MTRLSILESGVGERELKISTYRRSDYVIFEMVKGFFFGTICFCTVLLLWGCSRWDIFNQWLSDIHYGTLLKQLLIFYGIFMAVYLVICVAVAIHRHKVCRERRNLYLHFLHRLNKSYLAEEKAGEEEDCQEETMVQLLKIKEHIYRFIGKYEIYAMAVFRFLVAFLAFSLINHQIGYMDILKEYPIALLCALLCSFLPSGMMLFFGALLILLNCYALSLELCGIVALIFVALFCIYYRFTSKKGIYTVLTSVLGIAGIPYVMPVAAGILDRIYTVVAVVCGEFVYFLLKSVNQNAALFSAKETITKKSVVTLAVLQIFTDKEMYFYLAAFAAAAVIVSCVRRLSVDHARTIAIVLGIAVQLGVICSGEIYLGETGRIVRVILGCMVSLVIALVLDFMILSVDYSRVEHTQFEDDEYYYYVRAVPKAFVSVEDKQVKHINAKRTKKRKSTRGKKVNSVHVNTEKEIGDELEEQVLKELHDK